MSDMHGRLSTHSHFPIDSPNSLFASLVPLFFCSLHKLKLSGIVHHDSRSDGTRQSQAFYCLFHHRGFAIRFISSLTSMLCSSAFYSCGPRKNQHCSGINLDAGWSGLTCLASTCTWYRVFSTRASKRKASMGVGCIYDLSFLP